MPRRIHPLSEYRFKKTDKLFLDTNDGDFAHQNMDFAIITDNNQLLKTRK